MGRREDLNRELNSYLNTKVKPKYRKPVAEPVPENISHDSVHVIEGEPSWWQKMVQKWKSSKEPEEDEHYQPPTAVKVEEVTAEEFEAEEKEITEEKQELGFWDKLSQAWGQLFGPGEELAEASDEDRVDIDPDAVNQDVQNSQAKKSIDPELRAHINTLIQLNIDALSHISPEELEKYKRSDNYHKFKETVEKIKEFS